MKFLEIDDPCEVLPISCRLLQLFGLGRDINFISQNSAKSNVSIGEWLIVRSDIPINFFKLEGIALKLLWSTQGQSAYEKKMPHEKNLYVAEYLGHV
uniref:Uncharacterized protein n=1 Tax=Anopheles albimanus TaxID=7167 RepID=A0A182F1U9_ANOAL